MRRNNARGSTNSRSPDRRIAAKNSRSLPKYNNNVSEQDKLAAAASYVYKPEETFHLISEVDQKLASKQGLFDEDAHNMKRQMLLKRAAEAKRRIDAMNAKQEAEGLTRKTSFEMIEEQLELEHAESFLKQRLDRKRDYRAKTLEIAEKKRRKWLVQQGKSHMLDFQDDQIRRLKECFNSLDEDSSGSIGVDEIKGPLIGLGLVNSFQEVENLVKLVDEDGSGMIEFPEFLDIILNKSGNVNAKVITNFFKDLTNGKYETGGLAFPNWVLQEQRLHLKNAVILENTDGRRHKGMRIMNAIKKMEQPPRQL